MNPETYDFTTMQIGCSESGLSAVPIDLYTVIIYTTYLVLFQ